MPIVLNETATSREISDRIDLPLTGYASHPLVFIEATVPDNQLADAEFQQLAENLRLDQAFE